MGANSVSFRNDRMLFTANSGQGAQFKALIRPDAIRTGSARSHYSIHMKLSGAFLTILLPFVSKRY